MNQAIVSAMAQEKLTEVDLLVKNLAAAETQLEAGYAKLAQLLEEVSENRYWLGAYDSYGKYLEHIQTTYGIGKTQLYNYRSVAHALKGDVSEEQLNKMGISKALKLRDAKNITGQIPESVLTAAMDPKVSVQDIAKLLYDSGSVPKPENTKWRHFDLSGYYTDEQWATVQDAFQAAQRIDPPISQTLPEHSQRVEAQVRLSQEFLNTYPADDSQGN